MRRSGIAQAIRIVGALAFVAGGVQLAAIAAEPKAATAADQLAEATASRAQAAKYSQLASQNRQLAVMADANTLASPVTVKAVTAETSRSGASPAPAASAYSGEQSAATAQPAQVLSPASGTTPRSVTAVDYQEIATLADKLASDAQKVADFHAQIALIIQREAAVTARVTAPKKP